MGESWDWGGSSPHWLGFWPAPGHNPCVHGVEPPEYSNYPLWVPLAGAGGR